MTNSKPLGMVDESGFAFVKEVLDGQVTCAINFDRLQKHPKHGYIIFEFLEQKGITKEQSKNYDRAEFAEWFRKLNKESCQ